MSYEGEFVDGELEGIGKVTFHSGDLYEGSFVKSMFNGYGNYKYADGLRVSIRVKCRLLGTLLTGSVQSMGRKCLLMVESMLER